MPHEDVFVSRVGEGAERFETLSETCKHETRPPCSGERGLDAGETHEWVCWCSMFARDLILAPTKEVCGVGRLCIRRHNLLSKHGPCFWPAHLYAI